MLSFAMITMTDVLSQNKFCGVISVIVTTKNYYNKRVSQTEFVRR